MKKSIIIVALLVPYSVVASDVFGIVAIALTSACGAWIGVEASTRHGYCSTYAHYRDACGERFRECLGNCDGKICGCCKSNERVCRSETVQLVGSQPISQLIAQPASQPVRVPSVIRPTPVRVGQLGRPAEEFRKLVLAAKFSELKGSGSEFESE